MTAQPPEPTRPEPTPEIRASDHDREAVVRQLRDAVAEGILELEELDERLEHALVAKTRTELAALTADLPSTYTPEIVEPLVLDGGYTGASRGPGAWDVPPRVIARGGMAGVKIDFTGTECRLPEVVVEAHGDMAGVTVVIPDGWIANTNNIEQGIGGVSDKTTSERLPSTPLVRLTGTGGIAGVTVRHPSRWERRKMRNKAAKYD